MKFRDRVCVSDVPDFNIRILEEGHKSSLSLHPRETKMHEDIMLFWWPVMNMDVAEFMFSCLVSKIEHQKTSGMMQPIFVPEWKWDSISMNFVGGLPKIMKGCDSI